MQLGKSMEKMLTSTPEEFARFTKANSWQVTKEEREQPEAFNYIAVDKFLLRSQLDCEDPRLPGKTFDLKTRAAVAIRLDVHNYELNQGYQLNKLHGYLESFEREYYDMMRSAFLKYSLQVRIGQMDGIFVAFHNTARVFGFQYISLDEMDSRLFGTSVMGDECFKNQLRLLNRTLDEITAKYPHQDLKITVDTDETIQTMNVWVETMPLGAASSPNGQNAEVTFDEDGILEMQPGAELSLWQIVCYSDINGVPTVGPFELSGRAADKWELRYKIAELKKPHMMNEYRRMKAIQAEILSDDEEREFAVAAAAAASAGRKIDNIEGIGLENKRERVASKRDQMRAMLRRISEQGRVKQENEERHQADKEFLVWEPKGYTKIKNLPMSSPVAVSEQPLPKKEESEDVVQSKVQSSSQPFIKKPEDEVVIEPSPTSTATILSAPSPPRQESIAARLVRRLRESESASTTDSLSEITMDAPSSTIPAAYYRRGYDSKLIKLAIKDLLLLQKSMSGRLEDKEEQKMLDIIKERHSWLVTSLNPFDEIRLKLLQIPPNFEEFGQLDREHLLRISRLFGQPTYLRTDLLTDYSLRRNLMRVTPKFRYRLHLDYFHNWIHKVATQKGDAQPFKSINDYLSLDDEDALMRTAHGLNITNKMITTHELAQGLDRKNAIKKAVLTQIFYAEKAFTDAELQAIGFYPRIFDADTFKTSRDILRGIGRNYKDISQLPRWDSPKETVSE
ncbi:hypothetical protein BX616_010384 [Lobosporangium transversale]|nr:hypothetical protein BX616_010384 [Lobosporangium transversale]